MIIIIVAGVLLVLFWTVFFLKPLQNRLSDIFRQSISPKEFVKYESLAIRETAVERIRREFVLRIRIVTIVFTIGYCIGLYYFVERIDDSIITQVNRPDFGEGKEKIKLEIELGNSSEGIELTVLEKEPEESDLKSFFEKNAKEVFEKALENNRSADYVTENLNLLEETSYGAEVLWKISNLKNISSYGKLRGEIPDEGEEVTLTATIRYGEYKEIYSLNICIYPKNNGLSEEEALKKYINEKSVNNNDTLDLPDSYDGQKITYRIPGDESYKGVIIFVLFLSVLLWLISSEIVDKEYRKRKRELMRDYPDIISRISILLASGISISECLKKIGKEYEEEKKKGRKPSAGYEELLLSVDKLLNTGQIEMAIVSFGQRCNERYYRHLSTLLIQSMRKGSVQVSKQLQLESKGAFEIRKENARIAGEKARAKLMIPTFMLFALVIAMVIYPAWSGL